MTDYAIALCLTVIIECAVVLVWVRPHPPVDRGLIVLLVVGLNLVSHPVAWMAYGAMSLPRVAAFVGTECTVIVFESMALSRIPGVTMRSAAWAAIAMNATSASVGLLVS